MNRTKIASYARIYEEFDMSVILPALIKSVKNKKGYDVRGISFRSGYNADDFMSNALTVVVWGFGVRKPRFIRPNYSRVDKRRGNSKLRKIISSSLRK